MKRNYRVTVRLNKKEKENLMLLKKDMYQKDMAKTIRSLINVGLYIYENENLNKLMHKKRLVNRKALLDKLIIKELFKYQR